jgi:excisionase family DNA binding protein
MGKKLIKASEAAEILGVHPNAIHSLLKSGELKGFKIRTIYRVEAESVEAYAARTEPLKDALRIDDVMEDLALGSRVTAYKLIEENGLPAHMHRGEWRIPRADYEEWKRGLMVA